VIEIPNKISVCMATIRVKIICIVRFYCLMRISVATESFQLAERMMFIC